MSESGFSSVRAKLYEEAMSEYPEARREDIKAMHNHLNPQKGERVLGLGEGNGYFCPAIAKAVGKEGEYLVTDPSEEQIENLVNSLERQHIEARVMGGESLDVRENHYDKVWSFGSFHHLANQTKTMKNIYSALRPGGKVVICDVFQGTRLSKHFDKYVARYCVTGHEVKFLSEEFANSLCCVSGFDEENVSIVDLPQKWKFETKEDLGRFIYKLHALTRIPGDEEEKINRTVEGCEEVLGINQKDGRYELNWPMKAVIATK